VEHILQQYSNIGLFFIILVEEAGVPLPIPGDIFIAAAAAIPKSNYFIVVAAVVGATLTGSTILFTISQKIGSPLIKRFGKYIRFTPQKVKKVERWFEKYGGRAIVIGRLIPGLRIITPIVAGTFKVDYKTFCLYTAVAAFIWANIYFVIGKFFGNLFALATSR